MQNVAGTKGILCGVKAVSLRMVHRLKLRASFYRWTRKLEMGSSNRPGLFREADKFRVIK
jgi:hypothetical protein